MDPAHLLPQAPILAHRLDGDYDFNNPISSPGKLRSSPILETKPLAETQQAQIRHILNDSATFGGEGMRCFSPGLGFTIGTGPDALDILICLQCYRAYFLHGETKRIELLSKAGHDQLLKFYTELFPITGTPESA
jgi:hypothetical protein